MKIKKLVYMLEEKERNIGLPTGVRRFVCRGVVAGLLVAFLAIGGQVQAFADDGTYSDEKNAFDTTEVSDDSQISEQDLVEEVMDTSEILQFGGLPKEDIQDEDVASVASVSQAQMEKKIVASLSSFKHTIDVRGWGLTTGNVAAVVGKIVNAHPELVYVAKYGYMRNIYTGQVTSLKITYKPNAATEKKQLAAAIAKVNRQVKTSGMKPAEIVLAYHEYITSTIEYDTSDLASYNQVTGRDHMYDMYGVLVKKKAVCQGYAETMWYFLRKAGVPCGIATSTYINHAWNVVCIDGKWYHVDATWDDPVPNLPGQSFHKYFLISMGTLNKLTKLSNSSYSLGRYDTSVTNVWRGRYRNDNDRRFEKGQFWNAVNKVIYYRKGYWYSIKQASKTTIYKINKSNFKTGVTKSIFTGYADWIGSDGSTSLGKQYGSLFLAQEMLYFTTPRYVGRIDLDASSVSAYAVYDIRSVYDTEGINIYAMGYDGNGDIVFWVSYDPMCSVKNSYLLNACMSHSWKTSKLIKKPTYASTGIRRYTCSKCGYIKNKTIPKLKLAKTTVKTQNIANGIKLSWNRVSGAAGYKVYRKIGRNSYRLIRTISSAKVLTMTNKGLTGGIRYTYVVKAFNKYTTGTGTARTQYYIADTKVSTKNASSGILVTWNRVKGVDGYMVYRRTSSGKYRCIKKLKAGTVRYTDRSVSSGVRYAYFVKPYKGKVTGAYSKQAVWCLRKTNVELRTTGDGVRVVWSKITGADSYKIYRKTASGSYKVVKTIKSGNTTGWTDRSAKKGVSYTYTVKSMRNGSESAAATGKTIKR